jgi:hypothetical protein
MIERIPIFDIQKVTERVLDAIDAKAEKSGSYTAMVPESVAARFRDRDLDEQEQEEQARKWQARREVVHEIATAYDFSKDGEATQLRQPVIVFTEAGSTHFQSFSFHDEIPALLPHISDSEVGRILEMPRIGRRVVAEVRMSPAVDIYVRDKHIPRHEGDSLTRNLATQIKRAVRIVDASSRAVRN